MNPIHFIFKSGWIFLLAALTLILCSVFVQFGPELVIAQWDPSPVMSLGHKIGLFLTGSWLVTILLFRVWQRGS